MASSIAITDVPSDAEQMISMWRTCADQTAAPSTAVRLRRLADQMAAMDQERYEVPTRSINLIEARERRNQPTKLCGRCGQLKIFADFGRQAMMPDGYRINCKDCLREQRLQCLLKRLGEA